MKPGLQAAFTIKEVRELMKLPDVAFHSIHPSLIPDHIMELPRSSRRLMEVLVRGGRAPSPKIPRSWSLDSCLSPRQFVGRNGAIESTEFDVTSLEAPFDPQSCASITTRTLTLPSDVVIRSVGYRAVGLPGLTEAGIRFEKARGVFSHDGLGRVVRSMPPGRHGDVSCEAPGQAVGFYCAGWVKTGPTGVIATTMHDAFCTGDAIVHDWESGRFLGPAPVGLPGGWEAVEYEMGPSAALSVSWSQWQKIDSIERERGRSRGKQREKFTDTAEMLSVIK